MKITPIYKHEILSLPAEAVSEKLSTATADELRVLLAVMMEREFTVSEMAAKLDMTENALRRAISAWESAGVLTLESSADNAMTAAQKKREVMKDGRKLLSGSTLPHYSSDEIASVMERTRGSSELLDSCQQTLGKVFNTTETAIIIGLVDHLSLSPDYILLLCSHAAHIQKKSVRYVEKMALDLFDRDIITYAALEEELSAIDRRMSLEGFVRDLFGMGNRALIKKERDFIANWVDKYGFDREMIRAAYEITIEKTKEANLNYANAVIENWYAAGHKTVEDVEAAEAQRSANRPKDVPTGTSFATDSFFEAALQRSYGEDSKK
ncbi:MAG: DnaD domain protein [Clostridia bacterium]|nr:DnaD domain protein [Clostridia bacterium]